MNSSFAKEGIAVIAAGPQNIGEFEEVYKNYKNRIFRYIRFRVGTIEEAEDLTSQTFLKAIDFFIKHQIQIRNNSGWLYKIAGNLVRDWYRKKKPILLEDINAQPGFSYVPDLDLKIDEEIQDKKILVHLNQLKEKEQQIIILKIFEDLTFQEIAKIVNKKESAIKMLYYRALNKLRRIIKN